MEDHEVQLYISLPAANLDEYVAQLRKHASNWDVMEPALTNATIEFHDKQGDLPELAKRAGKTAFPRQDPPPWNSPTRAPTPAITAPAPSTP